MSINHVQFATLGTYPGCSAYNLATLGFGAIIEIIVVPPVTGHRGGGPLEVTDIDITRREIMVRVTYKDRSWSTSIFISSTTLNKVIDVYAVLKATTHRLVEVTANLIGYSRVYPSEDNVQKMNVDVKVTRKNTKGNKQWL